MLQIRQLQVQRGEGAQAFSVGLPQLELARGEVAAITGPSGCGKSTLLEMVGLILEPDRVDAFQLDGERPLDIAALLQLQQHEALAGVRARYLGFVLQTGGLLPYLSVRQNVELPRRLVQLPRTSKLIQHTIERLGLQHLLNKKPHQLSIGERQRAAFVRAIAHEPRLLLADEPTAALDPLQARKLFDLIVEISRNFNITALIVSHDWDLVRDCGIRNISGHPLTAGKRGTEFRDNP